MQEIRGTGKKQNKTNQHFPTQPLWFCLFLSKTLMLDQDKENT